MKTKIGIYSMAFFAIIFVNKLTYAQGNLVINEIMAVNNNILQDEDGNYPDWIEIHNPDTSAASLDGWHLTDDIAEPSKWAFPEISILPGEYLTVFASGKDRDSLKNRLHANFKLGGGGDFLALVKPGGTQYATVFAPNYPEQYPDISYGLLSGKYVYFSKPTPGAVNQDSLFLSPPKFSKAHAYCYEPFVLELTHELDGVEIFYTLDASTPSKTNGTKYTSPISINTTAVIRATATKPGLASSITKTQSYIFPHDVLKQTPEQAGYPSTWLSPINNTTDYNEIPANYGMRTDSIKDLDAQAAIVPGLQSLPVVSIVSDIGNFFSKDTSSNIGGIYMYNGAPNGRTILLQYHRGRGWTRPASVEYFNSEAEDGNIDFQSNCAIRIHGGATRTIWKTEKHSFKIGFKAEYGPTKLKTKLFGKGSPNQYDWLVLRGGFAPRLGQQVRDPWAKSTLRDMGQYAAYSKFVHVYINGLYWGMYNLSEQMDENCMRDHLGGKASDYDIVKDYLEVESGDTLAWVELASMAANNIDKTENYQKLLGNNADGTPNPAYEKMLNALNFADYMIMNIYAGMGDWDHHNWMAAKRKTDSEGFHFLVWDAEAAIRSIYDNRFSIDNLNRPTGIFTDLLANDDFKKLLVSRVNKHFFEEGALTPKPCLERYEKWFDIIDTAIVSESARWVYNEDDYWQKKYHEFIYNYFPRRTEIVFKQFIGKDIYPAIAPPVLNTENDIVPEDFELTLSSPSGGEIRYTLDGTDPGHFLMSKNNSIKIYDNQPIPITADTITIYARVKKDSLWSTLMKAELEVGEEVALSARKSNPGEAYLFNYPNPAKNHCNIVYSLPAESHVTLKIYNMLGGLVSVLEDCSKSAGEHKISWNTSQVPAGTYVCVLEDLGNGNQFRSLVVKE